MPHIIPSRHAQGLAAYRAGFKIAHVFEVCEEIESDAKEPEDASPSFIAGFVDGLIDDVRQIAATSRGGK